MSNKTNERENDYPKLRCGSRA